jgi:hypothetical protein
VVCAGRQSAYPTERNAISALLDLPNARWLEVLLSETGPVSRRVSARPPLAARGYKPQPNRQRRRLVEAK